MTEEQDKQQKSPEEIIYEWWQKLKGNKGRRAELRRAKNLDDVFFSPAYHDLFRRLNATGWRSKRNIALIAGGLAHLEVNSDKMTFASQMASPGKSGKKARVSGLRFRRLLQNKTPEDFFGSLIRTIRLLDKSANVRNLAKSIYWWNDRTKRDWAFEYYAKAPAEA